MTWTPLQLKAMHEPAARAVQVAGGEWQHFQEIVSPNGEDAGVGLTVNR